MRFRAVLLALLLVAGFIILTSRSGRLFDRLPGRSRPADKIFTAAETARTAGLSADELNNIEIYKSARHATVHITSTVLRRNWFYEIYPAKDIGSGFVIDDEGHILTNSHVLLGGGTVQVTLENQEMHDARILARDRKNDLGLIKITPKKKIPFLRLGDSEHLQVGQKVLAIGNPFGLEGTLTTGIISSIGRTIQDEKGTRLEGMVQTDAAINPGNSGGPLLDSFGNVIGINTAIYGAQGNIGIGFAMPIDRAKTMLEDYRAGRSFRRPWLGVAVMYVAGDLAQALDLPAQGGLLVQDVARGSSAASAGIRGPRQIVAIGNIELGVGGDLIMAIDGREANRNDAITRALSNKRPGDRLELTVFRAGRSMKVQVTLGEDPNDEQ
jgi:S1-C subfamily serine protease